MAFPLVSICMPAYNAEDYVADAIESALAQTWPNIELIVVNDGSNDNTGEIVDAYAGRSKVTVIHQKNQGQCAAANHAYHVSNGELIKFFDADDLISTEFIEKQVKRLDGSRTHVASAEWARFYNDPSEAIFEPEPVWQDMNPVDWLVTAWEDARPMMQCALWLIPRNVLESVGGWDERLSLINDFEFFTRVLIHSGGVRFTPGARLYYRSGLEGSLSGCTSRQAVESEFLSLKLGTTHLLNAERNERTRQVCANVLQDFVYRRYPHYTDLLEKAQACADALGGGDIKPTGPPGFQILRPLLGWRLTRRLERFAVRKGLNRASISSIFSSLAE